MKGCLKVGHGDPKQIKHEEYPLVMTNIAMERSTIFKSGKPSISMGHLFSMAMLVITRLGT